MSIKVTGAANVMVGVIQSTDGIMIQRFGLAFDKASAQSHIEMDHSTGNVIVTM